LVLIPAFRTRIIYCVGFSEVLNEDVIRNYAGEWNYANIRVVTARHHSDKYRLQCRGRLIHRLNK